MHCRPRSLIPVGLLLTATLLGCGGHYVNRGADLFADGRYVEAAEVFERTQDRLGRSDAVEQARYGLYRGATLFVLGDFAHAQSWLTYAYEVERVNPGVLGSDERAFLDRVWIALEARYRGLPPASTNTAVAATQPPPAPSNTTTAPVAPAPAPTQQRTLVAP
jgi:hypothetical protein